MPIAAGALITRAAVALPAARAAARRLIQTGGSLLKRAAPVAIGTVAGSAFPSPWGGPGRRRSRGRGITAAELRGFRKVANLVKQYTAPGRRTLFRAPGRRRR